MKSLREKVSYLEVDIMEVAMPIYIDSKYVKCFKQYIRSFFKNSPNRVLGVVANLNNVVGTKVEKEEL
jgi:hypothetical protein